MTFKTIRRAFFSILICLSFPALSAAKPEAPMPPMASHIPIAGDWSPTNSGDEIGVFQPELAAFHLCPTRSSAQESHCVVYQAHDGRRGWPLIGRWAPGDTRDRPALYDPQSGWIHIYDFSDCLPEQCAGYGSLRRRESHDLGATGATPVAGDWNASGVDSVALLWTQSIGGAGKPRRSILFSDGFTSRVAEFDVQHDLSLYSVISGDWRDTQHVGDSLGFYHRDTAKLVLLDGLQSFQTVQVSSSRPGDIAFGGNWLADLDTFALYTPPPSTCTSGSCHLVELMDFYMSSSGLLVAIPVSYITPHIDPRFPDDPGNPPSDPPGS